MIDNTFFERQTLSSRVKASIVSEYFPKYCKIIVKGYMPNRIGYFDLFAGPGVYEDGNCSTPLLVAKNCFNDRLLKKKVWMVFNDKEYSTQLQENFLKLYPDGTFAFNPHFGHSTVGECEAIDRFITQNHMENGKNECPAVLFIDPFGYKGINTATLSKFLSYWGNELFIFINTKRINPALENEKFEPLMRCLFPQSYNALKALIRDKRSVSERLQFIIDNLGKEYELLLGGKVYYTAFKFQEEDVETTSHFILHITKSKRGFDLIKQIYNDFANVGTIFDGINTYTFDVKKILNPIEDLFDMASENIDILKENLYIEYKDREISALDLFEEHQQKGLYCRKHYTEALRRLVAEGKICAVYQDNKQHKVRVLLIKDCILRFK